MAARRATVVGSSAYELERIGVIPEIPLERPRDLPRQRGYEREREHVEVRPETEERIRQRARSRAMQKAARSQYVSAFAVVGAIAAFVMVVFMLMIYVQLTVITGETTALETQLEELQLEQDSIAAKYNSTVNLGVIEDYARNVLGMTEPAEGQIFYLENKLEDEAVILNQDAVKDFGVLSVITSFFSSIME